MEWLQHHDLQSDERFAESYINMRKGRGFGPIRIAIELKERGVDEHVYLPYLNTNDTDWEAILRALHLKKYDGEMPEDQRTRAKQVRFLQYRGFALDKVLEVLKQ